ncbi:hypothetical protein BGZ80_009682 [Entomortierella chlamydospora]|uniref:Uncharacterized protein n=1 Tax=Entomortierella chlamydospora TaxID=101097 RepID=A0A9P6MX89_9FUNG|nr:hypothetical protein BGZ80_009682 [Entomortierella chlamydospora]
MVPEADVRLQAAYDRNHGNRDDSSKRAQATVAHNQNNKGQRKQYASISGFFLKVEKTCCDIVAFTALWKKSVFEMLRIFSP